MSSSPSQSGGTEGDATRFILEVEGKDVSLTPDEIVKMVEAGTISVETVVSLLREAGVEPLVFKVFKPVREVTRHEVEVAFARCIAGAPLQEHAPRSSRS